MQRHWRERKVSKTTGFSKLPFCQYLHENIWSEAETVINRVPVSVFYPQK